MKNFFASSHSVIVGSLSLAVLSLTFSAPAEAITWNWTYTQLTASTYIDPGDGSGTLTTEDVQQGGGFLITSITGGFTGFGNITGLVPGGLPASPTPPGSVGLSNRISSTGLFVDSSVPPFGSAGVAFTLFPFDTSRYSFSGTGSNVTFTFVEGTNVGDLGPGTGIFTATPVPEPLTLLGATAAVGLGAAFKRRSGKAQQK